MTNGVDAIIDRLGGAEAAAQLTRMGTEAVRKWRQSGSIPSRHWAAVIAATGLSLSDLPGGLLRRGQSRPSATATRRHWGPRRRSYWPTGRRSGAAASAHTARPPEGEVGFNTDDRLSGDPDRPVLQGPDRNVHLPAHREHRHQGEDVEAATIRRAAWS